MITLCFPCRNSMHKSCVDPKCECAINGHKQVTTSTEESEPEDQPVRRIRTYGREANLKDPQSTGRKRAAVLYPLDKSSPCEWRGLSNCGGFIGILGCYEGYQQARHHGPDKSVTNNEPGNVHRICHACHNRWHSANDTDYDWTLKQFIPHSPRPQTADEQARSMVEHLSLQGKRLKKIID